MFLFSCLGCTDYKFVKKWRESDGKIKWRDDGKCGKHYQLPDRERLNNAERFTEQFTEPAQCDPDGQFPCCHLSLRQCSGTRRDCTCEDCIDYRRIMWRDDLRCGSDYPLADGTPAQCNPRGETPCCNSDLRCSHRSEDDCTCENCTDHTLTIKWTIDRMCHDFEQSVGFKCDNKRCVHGPDLCDRRDDCGDMSDEIYCTSHMICNYTLNSSYPTFVSSSAICDGYPDCFDWSDECNGSCGREILGSWVLKITCFLMGILAVVFNCVSVFHGFTHAINDCPTEKMMITKVLMTLIGSGDFLIGVYLIVLSFYDSLVYGSSYCVQQPEWLTGTPCKILGVVSTVGSQLSLFSMTTLSCIIMYGVVSRKMTIPEQVTRKSVLKAASLALTVLITSLLIAVTPLVPSFEDYFVQVIYYDLLSTNKSLDYTRIMRLNSFQSKAHHALSLSSGEIWSWREIRKSVYKEYGDIPSYPVHFYGNDAVCLFKYFVRRDNEYSLENEIDMSTILPDDMDSKKLEADIVKTRDIAVWTMLIVNFVCFVIITVCYIAITWKTRKSTQESGQHDNPDRLRENKALEKRIILIIVTYFLCWVPFIIISGMHNLKYIDASTWYTPFAMTVLPINSVINPLLYDKKLLRFLESKVRLLGEYITARLGNFSVRAVLNRVFRRNQGNVSAENALPMEPINH